jgi:hypothetical protein
VLCGLSKICGVGFSFQAAVVLPERAFHAVAGERHRAGFGRHGFPFVGAWVACATRRHRVRWLSRQLMAPPAMRISILRSDRLCCSVIELVDPSTVATHCSPERQNASDVGDPDGVTGVQALVGGWVDEPNEREANFPRIVAVAPGFGD